MSSSLEDLLLGWKASLPASSRSQNDGELPCNSSEAKASGAAPKPAEMQQNATLLTPKQLTIQERRAKLVAFLLGGKDVSEVAQLLGVDRVTVYRDFEEWAKSDQAVFLQVEWLQRYEEMKKADPARAFAALTKLVMKLLEKQAKIEFNLSQTNVQQNKIVVEILDNSKSPAAGPGASSSVSHASGPA